MHNIFNRMEVSTLRVTQADIIMTMIMYMLASMAIILAMSSKLSLADDDMKPNSRMMNGTDASVSDYPFVASVQINGEHECTGSIINENWILTAAHCVYKVKDVSSLSIVAGTRKLDEGGIRKNVVKSIYYPSFNPPQGFYSHDIAVLKMGSSLSFDQPNIAKITISEQGDPPPAPGTPAIGIGYGAYEFHGKLGRPLQKIEMEIVSNSDCTKLTNGTNNINSDICAMDPQKYRCVCHGDSGGPLVVNGIQIGVVSGTKDYLCYCKLPTMYTSIALFRDWINNSIAS